MSISDFQPINNSTPSPKNEVEIPSKKLIIRPKLSSLGKLNSQLLEKGAKHLMTVIREDAIVELWPQPPSRARLIVEFLSKEAAQRCKAVLEADMQNLQQAMNEVELLVSFGNDLERPITSKYLEPPKAEKQFLISPPASPPHDWESRMEDPPNKLVHSEDLAKRLEALVNKPLQSPFQSLDESPFKMRDRSQSTTLLFHPEDHGSSPHLPCISVEDTGFQDDDQFDQEELSAQHGDGKIIFAHTTRPPVELMEE